MGGGCKGGRQQCKKLNSKAKLAGEEIQEKWEMRLDFVVLFPSDSLLHSFNAVIQFTLRGT